jgi:hypothetical protein
MGPALQDVLVRPGNRIFDFHSPGKTALSEGAACCSSRESLDPSCFYAFTSANVFHAAADRRFDSELALLGSDADANREPV